MKSSFSLLLALQLLLFSLFTSGIPISPLSPENESNTMTSTSVQPAALQPRAHTSTVTSDPRQAAIVIFTASTIATFTFDTSAAIHDTSHAIQYIRRLPASEGFTIYIVPFSANHIEEVKETMTNLKNYYKSREIPPTVDICGSFVNYPPGTELNFWISDKLRVKIEGQIYSLEKSENR